jgi:Amt family ammonium transporter
MGNRHGFGRERFEPHNILLTFMGASLLWVGWFGFNSGSALSAGFRAGIALLNTQIATSTAALAWLALESSIRKQPSVLGILSGAISGLVAITPGCGYVDHSGAFFIGLIAGPICYYGARLKHSLGYDDALDAFGVHAVGGIVGGFLIGFLASEEVGGVNGIFYGGSGWQVGIQLYGIVSSAGWSAFGSFVLLKMIDFTVGLRVSQQDEQEGLDTTQHGETICSVPGVLEGAALPTTVEIVEDLH